MNDDKNIACSQWAIKERPFIEFCKKNTDNAVGVCGVDVLDERRVVFVSLIGLHKTWKQTPLYILYSCLIFLPMSRQWLYSKRKKRSNHDEIANDNVFMSFLRFKNEQSFVFWAGDDAADMDMECDANPHSGIQGDLFAPFWKNVSKRLSMLYDPITRRNYAPLKADDFFKDRVKFVSRFQNNSSTILSELYFVHMKFKAVQEILYQSNRTLNAIVSFAPDRININHNRRSPSSCHSTISSPGFWISADYDPET
eukprot:CAMPEP_0202689994 /NCGR_PEP_ID=MMETSP1385-20130828/5144_1 /ASSEMBLY_ACC=CAM_ASM_000861 /TAXON_ID=933848 /ORGANISM="Elphidium margaritaceum" /LENGTH=253 /DNA_ID=CAMNT_0049345215 /DNA_START=60 /DNA_END=821 /DNA_ORIENTATION=-